MADSNDHTPADAAEPTRRTWTADAIVHDQNQHPRHPDRTGWSGDEIVHDQNQHPRHPDRTEWSGEEIVHDQNQHNLPSSEAEGN